MSNLKKDLTFVLKFIVLVFAITVLVNNLVLTYDSISKRSFNLDEFQHAHIAWNSFNGMLIYRDFFDHHGFLFPFLNGFYIKLFKLTPSFETLLALRKISFVTILGICSIVYLITHHLSKSHFASTVAASIFSMSDIVYASGVDIRPDYLQSLVMLLGIYFFILGSDKRNRSFLFLSGVFFGLVLCFNFKAIIILFAIFLYFILELAILNNKTFQIPSMYVLVGFLTVLVSSVLFFFVKGSLTEFLYHNINYNFHFFDYAQDFKYGFSQDSRYVLLYENLPHTIFLIISLVFTDMKKYYNRLFIFLAIIPLYGTFNGLNSYYMSSFIPFYCLFAAQLMNNITNNIFVKLNLNTICKILLIAFFLFVASNSLFKKIENEQDVFVSQKKILNWSLENIPRTQKILHVTNFCSGFIFNPPYRYFWQFFGYEPSLEFIKQYPNRDNGDKRSYREIFQSKSLDLVMDDYKVIDPLDEKTLLDSGYELLSIANNKSEDCIWVKKNSK